jgi:hypothetical protein
MSKQPTPEDEGFYLEFQRIGSAVKVTAIDPESGVEVSIVGDPRAGEAVLGRTATQKLRYVLDKRARAGQAQPSRPRGRGELV